MAKQEKNLQISFLHQIYGSLLTDKQRDMLSRYYDCDCSLAEIAEETGVSRQAVLDSIKHAEDALLKAESDIGMLRLKNQLADCTKRIADSKTEAEMEAALKEMQKLLS